MAGLLGLGAALVVLGLVVLLVLLGTRDDGLPSPPANAPPDTGIAVPPVDPAAAGRPQEQLAAWAAPLAQALDVPQTALEAYGYAAELTAARQPECGISWTVLVGIGSVESNHGRYDGAELRDDGHSVPPIRGAPLDGRPGIREIRDTDSGRLDGDPVYDRAVGAMQFLPGTWARYGADGDGDGVADPDDLDDAALAAAEYLCDAPGDMSGAEGWWRAVLTYNNSASYGRDVLDRADSYGQASRAV
ncbi:MAG: murein transglycosylase [Pseudonocardiaceae bacterium]|nr:murein transglycosylase [Pseudonocardiaceae bacterium]